MDSHDVDDLQEVVERNQEARQQVAREAEGLLIAEGRLFLEWWDSLEAVPTINRLRASLEDIRVEELTKALSRMGPDFSARERKVVEALTKGIINKILHTPVTQLRSAQQRSSVNRPFRSLSESLIWNLEQLSKIDYQKSRRSGPRVGFRGTQSSKFAARSR